MASELRVTTIANNAGTESVDTTYVVNGSAKSWVNFNGTGTIAARDSLNLSSLTDNGTGDYTITLSSAMNNSDYAFMKSPSTTNTGSYDSYPLTGILTTTTGRISQCRNAGVNADLNQVCLSIHGDLA